MEGAIDVSELLKHIAFGIDMLHIIQKIVDDEAYRLEAYKEIQFLKLLKERILKLKTEVNSSTEPEDETVILAMAHVYTGLMILELTDTEMARRFAKSQFITCINLLKDKELEPEAILPMIVSLNYLGELCQKCGLLAEAKVHLEEADELYIEFTENLQRVPINKDIPEAETFLRMLHFMTLSNLDKVCRALGKDSLAIFAHKMMNRQLSSDRVEFIKWVQDATILSQYFLARNFTQARYHAAAATYMLQKHQDVLKGKDPKKIGESVLAKEYNDYYRNSADVAKCWAKYGIALLTMSKERKRVEEEENQRSSNNLSSTATESTKPEIEVLRFVDIEPELEAIAGQVTDQYLLDFKDAKLMFLHVKKWLDKAKKYYTLDNYTSEYGDIVQGLSHAYGFLSFYVKCESKQVKMHERRINMLEDLLMKLDPLLQSDVCQSIWFELGYLYSHVLNVKMKRLQTSNEVAIVDMVGTINDLAYRGINYLRSFLDSLEIYGFCGCAAAPSMKKMSEDQLHKMLRVHFYLGKLYDQIFTSNLQLKIEKTKKSLDAFMFIVNYCDLHPEKVEEFKIHEIIKLSREYVDQPKLHELKQPADK